jgi:N-acetylglucosaminyl-diphospho-decaprenol L-rhamnosyltransferase
MSDAAVVIGNHQGESVLGDCLASLARQTEPPAEVIVVDGGSTDGSRRVAEEHGARWIAEENRGLGFLYNRGAEAATAAFVLLANNDIALDERCLELLRAPLADDPSLFAADARQMDWTGECLVHARVTLRRGRLLRELLPGFRLDLKVPADGTVPTVSANGGCMLVRREMLLDLGGFDETFFMDLEDLDLCWRAWLQGWGSVYVPDAWVRHRVGAVTTRKVLPRRLASSHHNLTRFAIKCLPVRDAATVVACELVRALRHPLIVPRGLAKLAGELPEVARLRRRLRPSRSLLEWMLAGQSGDDPRRPASGPPR